MDAIVSKVVIASAVSELGEVDAGKEWIVRRQFRSTDKVFGKREAVVSRIGLPVQLATMERIIGVIADSEGVGADVATTIAGEMFSALQSIQNEIYKDAAVDSEAKTVKGSVSLADFNIAAIAAYISENESGTGGERFKLTAEAIGEFFDSVISGRIIDMLIEKGISEEARLVKASADYRGLFTALAGKKVLTAQILDSMERIISFELAQDSDDDTVKVLAGIKGKIKNRQEALRKEAAQVDLI